MENTQPKARDVQKGGLTPFDQSETTRDRRITQRIRQALVNDSLLSMTAKNVKIITINGKATLRGPVRRAEEKEEIARQAAQIAGVQNVENQIEIEGK
jgi:osmotically-inducible protein OsmY